MELKRPSSRVWILEERTEVTASAISIVVEVEVELLPFTRSIGTGTNDSFFSGDQCIHHGNFVANGQGSEEVWVGKGLSLEVEGLVRVLMG